MSSYTLKESKRDNTVRVEITPSFDSTDWEQMFTEVRGRSQEAGLNWEIDATQLSFINSIMLGQIIEINSLVAGGGGSLRLILTRDSRLIQLIQLAKINRIVKVIEV